MHAAIWVEERRLNNAIADIVNPSRQLRALVASFDGERPLRSLLSTPGNVTFAKSKLLFPRDCAPGWFRRMLTAAPRGAQLTEKSRPSSRVIFTMKSIRALERQDERPFRSNLARYGRMQRQERRTFGATSQADADRNRR